MEIQPHLTVSPLFRGIVQSCPPEVQLCFLQFIQTQIILDLAHYAEKCQKKPYFLKLLVVLAYFKHYLNRVDRSMYYLFYEEKEFNTLEGSFIINIAEHQSQNFSHLRNQHDFYLNKLNQQTTFLQSQEQFNNYLQNIFYETDYPLPVCKRETIGVYCQTPFQEFVSLIRFPTLQGNNQFMEQSLRITKHPKNHIISQSKFKPHHSQDESNAFLSLRMQTYAMDFQLHNFILALFCLIAVNAKASKIVIKAQNDPIMKIAEFVTRANIFKNIILAIEENFNYLFNRYGDIYEMVSQGSNHQSFPKFSFWNGAMTIWVQQCQQLQNQLYGSFNYVILKQREQNTLQFLTLHSQTLPSVYSNVKLEIESNSFYQTKRKQLYQQIGQSYENFFQDSQDSFQILAKDFTEHQLDISLNQITVHKCGHSNHIVKRIPFFGNFIQSFKQSSIQFYQTLEKSLQKKIQDKKFKLGMIKDLIKNDLQFLEKKFVRPVILKEILSQAQQFMGTLVQKMPQFSLFNEQGMERYGVFLDFSHKDNLLDYFSAKSQTPNDCKPELRCLYDIYKDKSPEQIISFALSYKGGSSFIQSEIQEEFYESSHSNNSMVSLEEQ